MNQKQIASIHGARGAGRGLRVIPTPKVRAIARLFVSREIVTPGEAASVLGAAPVKRYARRDWSATRGRWLPSGIFRAGARGAGHGGAVVSLKIETVRAAARAFLAAGAVTAREASAVLGVAAFFPERREIEKALRAAELRKSHAQADAARRARALADSDECEPSRAGDGARRLQRAGLGRVLRVLPAAPMSPRAVRALEDPAAAIIAAVCKRAARLADFDGRPDRMREKLTAAPRFKPDWPACEDKLSVYRCEAVALVSQYIPAILSAYGSAAYVPTVAAVRATVARVAGESARKHFKREDRADEREVGLEWDAAEDAEREISLHGQIYAIDENDERLLLPGRGPMARPDASAGSGLRPSIAAALDGWAADALGAFRERVAAMKKGANANRARVAAEKSASLVAGLAAFAAERGGVDESLLREFFPDGPAPLDDKTRKGLQRLRERAGITVAK